MLIYDQQYFDRTPNECAKKRSLDETDNGM